MAEKFTDKLKGYLWRDDNDDYEDEYDDYEEEDEVISLPKQGNKVVSLNTGANTSSGQFKVMIYEPTQYNEDIPGIVDSLKNRKVCVVNLEKITDPSISNTIFHFLNGAIYAMSGNVAKVSTGIFIFAPPSIDIDGTVKKALENKGFFKWQ